jgi:hypothetical protein
MMQLLLFIAILHFEEQAFVLENMVFLLCCVYYNLLS